jgi:hypothetical protein
MPEINNAPSKLRWIWLGIGLAVAVGIVGSAIYARLHRAPDLRLSEHLATLVKGAEGVVLDFDREIDGPWDTLHVFGPYTPSADVDRQLGFAWGGAADSRSAGYDESQLVVFVEGQQVRAQADIGRELIAPAGPVPRAKAKFVVRGGALRLVE